MIVIGQGHDIQSSSLPRIAKVVVWGSGAIGQVGVTVQIGPPNGHLSRPRRDRIANGPEAVRSTPHHPKNTLLQDLDRNAFDVVTLSDQEKGDLEYWLARSPQERWEAVEQIRQVTVDEQAEVVRP